ncbi:hypothetical protein ISN45_At05g028770 [Arabidopsis thaliana x Arabidopsis arenosa]|nr:hypothetical protein ISN45_At05g028770 [Arabidopsis thaliana x Arabidopsis arenosa]
MSIYLHSPPFCLNVTTQAPVDPVKVSLPKKQPQYNIYSKSTRI